MIASSKCIFPPPGPQIAADERLKRPRVKMLRIIMIAPAAAANGLVPSGMILLQMFEKLLLLFHNSLLSRS